MNKILYIDVETTGVDPHRHGLVQLGQVIEINGRIMRTDKWDIVPFPEDIIDQKALDVTGMTRDQLFAPGRLLPIDAWRVIKNTWDQFINKFDRDDKFILAGYNVDAFDQRFLRRFIDKCQPEERFSIAGSYIGHLTMDPLPLLKWLKAVHVLDIPNLKLQTVCDHLGIKLEDAHDALADITATRQLVRRVRRMLSGRLPMNLGGLRIDLDDAPTYEEEHPGATPDPNADINLIDRKG